jgi:hypothetical protein
MPGGSEPIDQCFFVPFYSFQAFLERTAAAEREQQREKEKEEEKHKQGSSS